VNRGKWVVLVVCLIIRFAEEYLHAWNSGFISTICGWNLQIFPTNSGNILYIYIYWLNYNFSLTWIIRPFGDDSPNPKHDSSEGEQWGRFFFQIGEIPSRLEVSILKMWKFTNGTCLDWWPSGYKWINGLINY
jgi:hypothetical protein